MIVQTQRQKQWRFRTFNNIIPQRFEVPWYDYIKEHFFFSSFLFERLLRDFVKLLNFFVSSELPLLSEVWSSQVYKSLGLFRKLCPGYFHELFESLCVYRVFCWRSHLLELFFLIFRRLMLKTLSLAIQSSLIFLSTTNNSSVHCPSIGLACILVI